MQLIQLDLGVAHQNAFKRRTVQDNKNLSEILTEIYDTYRNAALNKYYYGALLARYQKANTVLEIAIAIGATSSGISGLALWQEPNGKEIWGAITLVSGVLAVAKPFLQLNKLVERYSKLFTGHLDNYLSLQALVSRIRRNRDLTEQMLQEFEVAEKRFLELSRDDDPQTVRRLHLKCENVVRDSIPNSVLWFPSQTENTETAPKLVQQRGA